MNIGKLTFDIKTGHEMVKNWKLCLQMKRGDKIGTKNLSNL